MATSLIEIIGSQDGLFFVSKNDPFTPPIENELFYLLSFLDMYVISA